MPDLSKIYTDVSSWVVVTFGGAIVSGVTWLIRRVFTNHKQIELLHREMQSRERQRNEDRERMSRIESDVTRVQDGVERIEGILMNVASKR